MITEGMTAPVEAFEDETGWLLKPEGACKGEICVPLPDGAVTGGQVDLRVMAERLGMAVVSDDETGLHALGPESLGGHTLTTAHAPELVLPDLDGEPFRLSSLRGQKVVLVAWAPY